MDIKHYDPQKTFYSYIHAPQFVVSNKELSPYDILVFSRIADYYNSEKEYAWPSIATLSRDLNFSESQIKKSIKVLEKFKVIEIERGIKEIDKKSGKWRQKSNRYRFPWPQNNDQFKLKSSSDEEILEKLINT